MELLDELRVALPGVQVLFAFLLYIPFAARFPQLSEPDRAVYYSALVLTALATVLLIAPSAHHRLRFRKHDKERLLRSSNRMMIGGLSLLAAAITTSVAVVTDLVYGELARIIATGAVALLFLSLWYIVPLARRRERRTAVAGDDAGGPVNGGAP